jgi:hypothetical protein
MTTVIKTKGAGAKRESSLASVLRESFVKASFEDTGRSIVIARTPEAYIKHGSNWATLTKQRIAEIAKERGLTIASWEESYVDKVPGLRVNFTKTIGGFANVFQGDVYADLLHHPKNKGAFDFINCQLVNGDENRGTMSVSYIPKSDSSRQEIRAVLRGIFSDMDKRITAFSSEVSRKGVGKDAMSFTLTYKDIPVLSSVKVK